MAGGSSRCATLCLALCTFVSATAPALAAAADPGIQYDPNSPAGTEYALPLAQARSQGADANKPSPSGRDDSDLFGAGISERAGSTTGADRRGSSAGGRSDATHTTPAAQGSQGGGIDPTARREVTATSLRIKEGGASGLLVGLGTAIAVLVAGLAIALGLRHRQRAVTG